MAKSKNLNFEIGLLEACLKSGKPFKQALAIEDRRKREAEKRARKAAKLAKESGDPEKAKAILKKAEEEEKAHLEQSIKKLEEFRLQRFQRKYHVAQNRMRGAVKKHLMMEKLRVNRLLKAAKAEKESPAASEKDKEETSGKEETSDKKGKKSKKDKKMEKKEKKKEKKKKNAMGVEEAEALVSKVNALDADFLAKVMEHLLCRRSKLINDTVGASEVAPEVIKASKEKYLKSFFNTPRLVKTLKDMTMDLEAAINGNKKQLRALNSHKLQAINKEKLAKKSENDVEGNGTDNASDEEEGDKQSGEGEEDQGMGEEDQDTGEQSDVSAGSERKSKKSKEKSKKRKGGYDSYDEAEDEDFGAIYGAAKKESKNRPGQRARRLKNAKLYGEDANHLKASKKDKGKRQKRMDKEGATPVPSAPTESFHPSWEAKRKQKELLSLAKEVKGKKTVFE